MPRKPTPLTEKQREEIIFRMHNGESPVRVARYYKTNPDRCKRIAGIEEKTINKVSIGERADGIMLRTIQLKNEWQDLQKGKMVKVKEINAGKVYHYSGEIVHKNSNYIAVLHQDNRRLSINFGDFCTNFFVEIL